MKYNPRIQFQRLRKNGRNPCKYPLDGSGMPLRITRLFPMKLKDISLDKLQESKNETDVVCISQMMSLFECFEKHDFDRSQCTKQVDVLQQCYKSYRDRVDLKNKSK